MEVTTSLG